MFESARLRLLPLTLEMLCLMRDDIERLEKENGFVYDGEEMTGFMAEYLSEQIRIIGETPESLMYNAFWLFIRNSDGVCVGSAAFKGLPDKNGEIELGYGINRKYFNNGYTTEAVGIMCRWALEQPGVEAVIAQTDTDGFASQKVLEKNGFVRYRFGDSSWYRLARAKGNKT